MQEILCVTLKLKKSERVQGATQTIIRIPFTGTVDGTYFKGKTKGACVDTQRACSGGTFLSARYLLVGKDLMGKKCKIFVENNGSDNEFTPTITTDSEALAFLEKEPLTSFLTQEKGKLRVHVCIK